MASGESVVSQWLGEALSVNGTLRSCPEAKGLGCYPHMHHLWLLSHPQLEEGSLAEAAPIHQEQPPKKQAAMHPAQLRGGCLCWFKGMRGHYLPYWPPTGEHMGSQAGCLWPW